jgi:protein-disulfide isomerase
MQIIAPDVSVQDREMTTSPKTTSPKTATKLSAKERREMERRRQKQQQTLLAVVVGVALLVVVVGGILLTVFAPVDATVDDKIKTAYASIVSNEGWTGTTEQGFYFIGAPNAPVVVEEFSSFSCPHCATFHRDVFTNIMDKISAGQVKFVYMPLTRFGSFESEPMAKAALCAGEQGKFWQMHDLMFDWAGRYGPGANDGRRLTNGAQGLGLDTGKFDGCMNSSGTQDLITKAATDAGTRGVTGTPTVFVDNEKVGTVGLNELRGIIEAKMAARQS